MEVGDQEAEVQEEGEEQEAEEEEVEEQGIDGDEEDMQVGTRH